MDGCFLALPQGEKARDKEEWSTKYEQKSCFADTDSLVNSNKYHYVYSFQMPDKSIMS